MFTDMNLCMNRQKFAALSAAEQQLLRDAAREVVIGWYRGDVAGNDVRFWAMISGRMEHVDNPDIASFRTATAGVYDSFYRQAGAKGREIVEAVRRQAAA
jgi:TRAP-type C4-dicarboxylate transport system substrate-binding protein